MDKEIKQLREELWKLFFYENQDKYKNLKIDEVMKKLIPKNNKLYRYRSINDNTIDILENDTIFLANPDNLNAPYDCHVNFDYQNYYAKEIAELGDQVKPVIDHFDENNRKIRRIQGIACFSSGVITPLTTKEFVSNITIRI